MQHKMVSINPYLNIKDTGVFWLSEDTTLCDYDFSMSLHDDKPLIVYTSLGQEIAVAADIFDTMEIGDLPTRLLALAPNEKITGIRI